MTTEQQEAAAPKRIGSGTITKPVRRQHPCIKPALSGITKTYAMGTEWTCDCGKIYTLEHEQRDGWGWREKTLPSFPSGMGWRDH